ncbi:N-acetylmuramoyl-L-alanine amidase family protein [Aestuariivirga litoralis]|uniref:N-acetylmuramoyl-L-alanine amidase family protein n=1 Tax=Aestuariivirga litoralis TaxID=2650924 RepID=UPI0018C5DB78|nr:N-acetylmuramoyl-L-alanine amidase [Aestuariivirga litoralis]
MALAAELRLKEAAFAVAKGHTKFEVAVSEPVSFSAMVVNNPGRVIIDLPKLDTDVAPGAGGTGAGIVSSYHYQQAPDGKARIILETRTPTVISWSTVKPAEPGKSPRLMLDLVAADATLDIKKADDLQTGSVTKAPAAPSLPKHVIVLDPGHGGIDGGAVSHDGVKEKDVVFAYAQSLKAALTETGRFDVLLTRDDDKLIKLEDRVKFARDHKADLFVAIHADMLRDQSVRGTTVYTVSDKASDDVAEALAQKENRADLLAGVDLGKQKEEVASTLINLMQRESKAQALHFAKLTVSAIRPVTEFTGQPMRAANFAVLKAPDVPSVLIELGYLSNTADKGMLTSNQWRKEMSESMTKAVIGYFKQDATAAVTP